MSLPWLFRSVSQMCGSCRARLRHYAIPRFNRLNAVYECLLQNAPANGFEDETEQVPNAFRGQQISVGDEGGNALMAADTADQLVEVGMQQRFTAAERNDLRPKLRKPIDAVQHVSRGYWRRDFVVLVAVRAGEIAAPDGNDLRIDRVPVALERASDHFCLTKASRQGSHLPH
jgi:hypothetical protein